MRLTKLSALLGALALPIFMSSAQAAPIMGGISFSDGLSNFLTTGPIVSTLTNIVDDPATLDTAQGCTTDFLGCPAFGNFANNFTITSGDQIIYQFNGYTFHLTTITSGPAPAPAFACTANGCADGLSFTADGHVTHAGFDPTLITIAFTAQGTCNTNATHDGCNGNVTASWSSSISSTGRTFLVPEPATATLIGIGLLAAGFASRRRKS